MVAPVRPDGRAGNSRKGNYSCHNQHTKSASAVLQVTIWRNTSDKGTWYSVIPTRCYKQGDETWKETDSLSFDDLLTMAKLLDLAHTWIMHQQQADAKARKQAGPTAA